MSAGLQVMQTLKKYPLAILCFFVFIACGVLAFMRGDRIAELTATEETLNMRIRVIEQNIKNSAGLENEVEQIKSAVAVMQARRFNRDERAANINFFYDMEAPFNVRINEISQQAGPYPFYEKGGIHEFTLNSTIVYNIALSGEFSDILALVHHLHQVKPFVRVAELQLTSGSRNALGGLLECRLRLAVMSKKN